MLASSAAWKAGGGAGVGELVAAEVLGLGEVQTWDPHLDSRLGCSQEKGAHIAVRHMPEWGLSFLNYKMKGLEEISDPPSSRSASCPSAPQCYHSTKLLS